ncbi:MAG: outer membrane protein assembly factor BamB family protein [Ktedonobacterales bacterium]
MDRISRAGASLCVGLTICVLASLLAGCGVTTTPPAHTTPGVFVLTMTRPSGAHPGPAYTTLSFVAPDTGKVRWQHREESNPFDPQGDADGPVVADGVVYMVGGTNTTSTDMAHPPSGMLLALRASDGQQLWRNDVGAFASQPVVDGDTIYITAHHVVKNSGPSKTIYALNRGDGSVRWKTEITDTGTLMDALALSHGRLFLSASQICFDYCSAAYLFALDSANGHVVWRHAYEGGNVTILPPVVDGDAVYARIESSDVGLHALSTADGHQLWQDLANSLFSSGKDYLVRGGMVYTDKVTEWAEAAHFTPVKYAMVALDGMTGAPRWQTPTDLYPMVLAVEGDRVIIRSEAPNPHASRSTSQYLDVISALRVSDGKRLWSVQQDAYGGNAVSAGAVLYITLPPTTLPPTPDGGQQAIAALRTADGSVLWRQPVNLANPPSGSRVNNLGIVYPAGNLICIFSGGILYGMRTTDGHTLWSANLSPSGDIQGATIVS